MSNKSFSGATISLNLATAADARNSWQPRGLSLDAWPGPIETWGVALRVTEQVQSAFIVLDAITIFCLRPLPSAADTVPQNKRPWTGRVDVVFRFLR